MSAQRLQNKWVFNLNGSLNSRIQIYIMEMHIDREMHLLATSLEKLLEVYKIKLEV